MSINITDAIFAQAEQTPEMLAVIDVERAITYRVLCDAVRLATQHFRQAGWKAGDIIGVSLSGDPTLHLVSALALARMGVIQVSMPPSDPAPLRMTRIKRLGISGLIVNDSRSNAGVSIKATVADPDWLDEPAGAESVDDSRAPGGDALWIINETSGTTADPKVIGISHAMVDAGRRRLVPIFAYRPGERSIHLSDLRFLDALKRPIYCLSGGGTVTFPPANFSTERLLHWIEQHQITHISCVPLHLHQLLRDIRGDSPRLPFVRILRSGTASLPISMVKDIRERISPNLYIDYGSTEAGPVTAATPSMLEAHPDTVGRPLAGIEFAIVDDDGKSVSTGVHGHVRVRGSGIGSCSLHTPDPKQSAAFREGWFYPGDVAVMNSDGLVFLRGRSDEVMNFDGILVGPGEIESVLREHPVVKEVAAFAMPSSEHQDIPAAAIVSDTPLPLRDLHRFCKERLGIRSPRMFLRFDEIPKNPMGKVLRRSLVEQAKQQWKRR